MKIFFVYSYCSAGTKTYIQQRFQGNYYKCKKWCERDARGWNFISTLSHDKATKKYSY